MRIAVLSVMLLFFSCHSTAETARTEQLVNEILVYAKCLDNVLGNFPSDEKAQDAMKLFYQAMLEDIYESFKEESDSGAITLIIEFMGRETAAGYLLAKFSEVDEQYQQQKQELMIRHDGNWKRVNQELWERNGCNAVHGSLIR